MGLTFKGMEKDGRKEGKGMNDLVPAVKPTKICSIFTHLMSSQH